MDMTFERGDPQKPRGHALAYFRASSEPDKVYATYIIVLPFAIDFAKYVPPFLTSHLGGSAMKDLSGFALPPVPDEVAGYEELERLSEVRDDDLIYVGTMSSFDVGEMMQAVSDVVSRYAEMWAAGAESAVEPQMLDDSNSPGVSEVLYGMMNERDRLAELSKFIGKMRFAVEGNDRATEAEMQEEIQVLGRFLPEHYYIPALIQAVMESSAKGAHLARLYLDRCYKLSNGDDAAAVDLEQEIEHLKASG